MKLTFLSVLILLLGAVTSFAGESAQLRIVVSIGPIHSLVSGIMAEAGAPKLLLRSGASPHALLYAPLTSPRLSKPT